EPAGQQLAPEALAIELVDLDTDPFLPHQHGFPALQPVDLLPELAALMERRRSAHHHHLEDERREQNEENEGDQSLHALRPDRRESIVRVPDGFTASIPLAKVA